MLFTWDPINTSFGILGCEFCKPFNFVDSRQFFNFDIFAKTFPNSFSIFLKVLFNNFLFFRQKWTQLITTTSIKKVNKIFFFRVNESLIINSIQVTWSTIIIISKGKWLQFMVLLGLSELPQTAIRPETSMDNPLLFSSFLSRSMPPKCHRAAYQMAADGSISAKCAHR
jgi:hypothetical protein